MANDFLSAWFGAACLGVALATAWAAGRLLGVSEPRSHNVALDGLRGYLAFGVLVHHAAVWHVYLTTGKWALPPPSLYTNLGHVCVTLFFMITGYLFIGKLLDARRKPVDWSMLFVSRILRIVPLFVVAILVLLACVGALTHWQLREPLPALATHVASWFSFTVAGAPDVNLLPNTGILIARVTWTLAYEWMFYLGLPLIALGFGLRVPAALWIGATALLALMASNIEFLFFPIAFPIGGLAAAVARSPLKHRFAHPLAAAAALGLVWLVVFVPGVRFATLLMGLAFCCVACGNSCFGLLSNRAALNLGDVSYAVYLIHGLALSIAIRFVVGVPAVARLAPIPYWGLIAAASAVVVVLATLSYRFLEMPCLRRTRRVDLALSRLLGRAPRAIPAAPS
jgi:peptidoglycan/LPS O-acetylase OafA/YrhL